MPVILAGATSGSTTLQATDATTQTLTLPSGAGTILSSGAPQSGGVIQVVQGTKTDTFSTSSTSKVDITGMSVSITPKFANSKIVILAAINYGGTDYNYYCDLLRGSTVLNAPSSGNNPCTIALGGITNTTYQILSGGISFLDSPSTTSATTYKLQIACQSGGSFRLNRSARDSGVDATCSSTITVMEIAA